MITAIKRWIAEFSDGMWFSGRPELVPLELDAHFPTIERLFEQEQWPFLRSDLEISHTQPRAVGRVAMKDGKFAAFFACHAFGDVGYLDMMIVDAAFRKAAIARPLYFSTLKELRRQGLTSLVVHTTNDSARLIRLLGFQPGQTFTLLARDPVGQNAPLDPLGPAHRDALVALDARTFGLARPAWVGGLLDQPSTRFYGLHQDVLVASLCVRARRDGAVALDNVNVDAADLEALVDPVLSAFAGQRVECFVKDGSDLDVLLRARGFAVPGFFTAIGPLVEWRRGPTGDVGLSPHTRSLSWF